MKTTTQDEEEAKGDYDALFGSVTPNPDHEKTKKKKKCKIISLISGIAILIAIVVIILILLLSGSEDNPNVVNVDLKKINHFKYVKDLSKEKHIWELELAADPTAPKEEGIDELEDVSNLKFTVHTQDDHRMKIQIRNTEKEGFEIDNFTEEEDILANELNTFQHYS